MANPGPSADATGETNDPGGSPIEQQLSGIHRAG